MPNILRRSRKREPVSKSVVDFIKAAFSRAKSTTTSSFPSPRPITKSCSTKPGLVRRHPIHRLPIELLIQIFILGSQDDADFPVTVSHVCPAWRSLALRTAPLWRRIDLDARADMWAERIRRARYCSLDVQLHAHRERVSRLSQRGRYIPMDAVSVQWYMHIVAPHVHRWRSLDISFRTYAPFLWNSALSLSIRPNAHAPLLESLSLSFPKNDDPTPFTLFASGAPRLHRVKLLGVRLMWSPSLFANLTHLDYTHHGFTRGAAAVSEVLHMLQVSSRLIELRIAFPLTTEDFRSMSVPPYRDVVQSLPCLGRLLLISHSRDIPCELVHLVAHLYTPLLTALHLRDTRHCRTSFHRLVAFVRAVRLPPSLLTLEAEDGWFEPSAMLALLRGLPNVKHLTIDSPRVTEAFLKDVAKIKKGRSSRYRAPAVRHSSDAHGKIIEDVTRRRRAAESSSLMGSWRHRGDF